MKQWPEAGQRQRQLLAGPAGDIECVLSTPRGGITAGDGALLACHPHPLYGGSMDNKVVTTLVAAAADAGLPALRFNFRGVGRSGGRHDDGRGESDDLLFVADALRQRLAVRRIVLAGFSFGGYVAIRACPALQPAALVTVAPAWRYFEGGRPQTWPDCPWLCVHGSADDVVPLAETEAALQHAPQPPRVARVEGVGHFFHGALDRLRSPVVDFLHAVAGDTAAGHAADGRARDRRD